MKAFFWDTVSVLWREEWYTVKYSLTLKEITRAKPKRFDSSPASKWCSLIWKTLNGQIFFMAQALDQILKLRARPKYHQMALCPKKKFNLKCLSQSIFLSVTKTRCYCEFANFPTRESSVSSTHFTLLLLKIKSTFLYSLLSVN